MVFHAITNESAIFTHRHTIYRVLLPFLHDLQNLRKSISPKLFVRLCCWVEKSIRKFEQGGMVELKLVPTKARLSVNRESWMESLSVEWWVTVATEQCQYNYKLFSPPPPFFESLITITRWMLAGDPTNAISYNKTAHLESYITTIKTRPVEKRERNETKRASSLCMRGHFRHNN